jgi:hypothetical protein
MSPPIWISLPIPTPPVTINPPVVVLIALVEVVTFNMGVNNVFESL